MCDFDPKKLKLDPVHLPAIQAPLVSNKLPKHNKGEKFLLGPIPWDWLCKAAPLKGKALAIAIALWHLAGMNNKANTVKLSQKTL